MSPPLKSFEGPDVQLLLDQIRAELGPGTKIDGAVKIRVGGLLGFFAKEHYRVVVEVPGTEPTYEADPASLPPIVESQSEGHPSSRHGGRNRTGPAEFLEQPAPAAEALPLSEPTTPMPVPVLASDVFSAMAEATDDVNDVGAAMAQIPGAAPVPAYEDHAVSESETPSTDTGVESFDAVLSRVATTLDGPGQAPESAPGPGARPLPSRADDGTHDVLPEPAGIASDAARFLAGNLANGSVGADGSVGLNGTVGSSPVLDDPVARALARTGLEERLVGTVVQGLAAGKDLGDLLLEAFGGLACAPPLPRRAGSLLVVVGDGAPARRLAAALADEMGIDPTAVPLASLDRQAHVHATGRLLVRSAEDAAELAPGWRRSAPAVVVVDACVSGPQRSWATHLIASLRPTAVWGVVDSTSKTDDIADWVQSIGGLDALALENLDATVSPAAALRVGVPVARLDGQPATATRWAATVVDRVTPCM